MARRRNDRPDMNGLLVIDKPLGLTSAAVCAKLRWLSAGARVGHAGTLDPMATGVLVVAFGKATKSIPWLMATEKQYRARIDLSVTSETDDVEGELHQVDCDPAPRDRIERALEAFTGCIRQRPPLYSAVSLGGRRAYALARSGKLQEDQLAEREVVIHSIDIVDDTWPELTLDIRCGKGVYIRSLARDLGRALGTGGCLTALRRTAVGAYTLDQARSLDALQRPMTPDALLPAPPKLAADDPPTPTPDAG